MYLYIYIYIYTVYGVYMNVVNYTNISVCVCACETNVRLSFDARCSYNTRRKECNYESDKLMTRTAWGGRLMRAALMCTRPEYTSRHRFPT